MILIISFIGGLFIIWVTIKKRKLVMFFGVIIVLILFIYTYLIKFIHNYDYGRDFEPIKREIRNIQNYEKATKLIIESWNKAQQENKIKNSSNKQLLTIQKENFKLKFTALPSNVEIHKKDTTIEFKPDSNDYKKVDIDFWRELPSHYAFKHSIIYSTKPIDIIEKKYWNRIFKIKNKYYYIIRQYIIEEPPEDEI